MSSVKSSCHLRPLEGISSTFGEIASYDARCSQTQTFAMRSFILLALGIYVSVSANFCENRFSKRLQTLNLLDQQLQYLWYQLGEEVINTRQNIIEAQAKSNKINWAVIAGVIAGNILRLAGRVSYFNLLLAIF